MQIGFCPADVEEQLVFSQDSAAAADKWFPSQKLPLLEGGKDPSDYK